MNVNYKKACHNLLIILQLTGKHINIAFEVERTDIENYGHFN